MEKKRYVIYAVINRQAMPIRRSFKTRSKAMNKVGNILEENGLEIRNIITGETKHNVEVICNNHNRFFVNRIIR